MASTGSISTSWQSRSLNVNLLRHLRRVLLVATVMVGASAAARADIVIDDFSAPAAGINYIIAGNDANPSTFVTNGVQPGINRTVTLTVTSPQPAASNSMVGNIGGPGGFFSMSLNVFSSGNAVLDYAFTSPTNLTPTGTLGSLRYLSSADPGNVNSTVPLNFVIHTATGDLTFDTTMNLTAGFTPTDVSLSNFIGTGDLTQATGMSITIVGGNAADVALDSISFTTPETPPTVPAPPAALLALLALPALGLRHRGRKREVALA